MDKKDKSYEQYKKDAQAHNQSIFEKYGAPTSAKPPGDRDIIPAASDKQFRALAFTAKTRLPEWRRPQFKYPNPKGDK